MWNSFAPHLPQSRDVRILHLFLLLGMVLRRGAQDLTHYGKHRVPFDRDYYVSHQPHHGDFNAGDWSQVVIHGGVFQSS